MKRSLFSSHPSRSSGFTLIELLVVIAIIAILASVLAVNVGPAINTAKRAKANNTANQIQTAVLGYNTEYSVYPVPAGTTGDYTITDTNNTDWGNLMIALCGNINPATATTATSTVANTRSIVYLTLKKSDVSTAGAPLNPLPPNATQLYFNIAIDNDYDGILGATPSAAQLPNIAAATSGTDPVTSGGTSTAGVAVWANCNGNATLKNPGFWVKTY